MPLALACRHIIQEAQNTNVGVERSGIALIFDVTGNWCLCDIGVHNDCKHLCPSLLLFSFTRHSIRWCLSINLNWMGTVLLNGSCFSITQARIEWTLSAILAHCQCTGNINCCQSVLSSWAWCAKRVDYFATDMSWVVIRYEAIIWRWCKEKYNNNECVHQIWFTPAKYNYYWA